MNGIEKIIRQLRTDSQSEIDKILAEAKIQANTITADFAHRAQQETAEMISRGEDAAAQHEERLIAMAAAEGRKEILAVKQNILDQAFSLALHRLCHLSDEEYIAVLVKLTISASSTGTEQLIFSPKDRARVGKAVVTAANKALPKGRLTLSAQTRSMHGGVVLSLGESEVNCMFETLIHLQRSKIANQVAQMLFA